MSLLVYPHPDGYAVRVQGNVELICGSFDVALAYARLFMPRKVTIQ